MKKGLTLIELVMVLAVLAIIGAILVPNFLSTTAKARLKSDIQSARVIQSAMELYNSERGIKISGGDVEEMVEDLSDAGYIKNGSLTIQTAGAAWEAKSDGTVVVNIGSAADKASANAAYAQLSDLEKPFVTGNGGE